MEVLLVLVLKTFKIIYIYNYIFHLALQTFINDDMSLNLNGCKMYFADHPNNSKKDGVCVYIKDSLASRICNVSRLTECIIIELIVNDKKGYIMSLYRSPSQTNDEFNNFLKILIIP